jgi:hypothetical protein
MRANSILATASSIAVSVVAASTAVGSSFASSERSIRTFASSSARSCASYPSTVDFSRAWSRRTACALSAAFQKSAAPACSSSSAIRFFLPSMSKMPPENLESAHELRHALSQGPDFHGGAA